MSATMSSSSDQLQEIKTLISSETKKSFAYSSLSHLQEQSSNDPASIETLAQSSQSLIALLVTDISSDDEETAAQALKCLGFMIYHPSLVSVIPVDDASLVLESLAKLIRATKMKSVCNLGVWCLSIQQFEASFLVAHFQSLLQAVVHAIDNPIGSLSTTFEAMQAVMKLAAQLSEKMRDLSHVWAPPIYRRLLSNDKRERDMSGRCLLKIRSIIIPPPLALSKALVGDMKQKLLSDMKDMLNRGMKVQAIQAWGWFIRLLGSHAANSRHLTNDMLKIPEQTFSDLNPQVQIASQVAWEGLIDALIYLPVLAGKTNSALENGIQQARTSQENSSKIQANGFLKSIKLIMTPLIGFMVSKCDVSVHSSCLDTWCYLLQKLDSSINSLPVITLVLNPIFEAVFQMKPDGKTTWLWNLCLNLLDDFILVKSKGVDYDTNGKINHHLSARTTMLGTSVSEKYSSTQYPIKWLTWDLSQLDFYIRMTDIIVSHAAIETVSPENRSLACDAALRIFRSVLKGVQVELKSSSANYDDMILCLNTILRFIKKICEELTPESSGCKDLCLNSLRFVEAVVEELEPSVLGSPLYKVALDLKYIEKLQSVIDTRLGKVLHGNSITYMDMVSPIVYLIVLYICVVFRQALNVSETEFIPQGMRKFFKFILSSYDPLENLLAYIGLLYKHIGVSYIKIWIPIAESLRDRIDCGKDFPPLRTESEKTGYAAICYLLCYPIIVCSCPQKKLALEEIGGSSEESPAPSQRKLDLEHTIETWRLLYSSISISIFERSATNSFPGDLCAILNECLYENTSMFEFYTGQDLNYKVLELDFLSLSGEVLICIFEQILTSDISSDRRKNKHEDNYRVSSDINSALGFASRFMKLSCTKIGTEPPAGLFVISRVISALARFISCLYSKQNILTFIEIMSCPLLQLLSHIEMQDKSIKYPLQNLWAEMLNCLERSQPPIIFDSCFLKLQACLLEKALDHTNSSISETTITFWNSTYGKQSKLGYPQNLLNVLDKLSRNGQVNLHIRSPPTLRKCNSGEDFTASQRYRVTSTNNRSSKRIELMQDRVKMNKPQQKDKLSSSLKRKKLELTEHQKEVRRAQQGRETDCNIHGPGIRTYTTVDFSQGNRDSQVESGHSKS